MMEKLLYVIIGANFLMISHEIDASINILGTWTYITFYNLAE